MLSKECEFTSIAYLFCRVVRLKSARPSEFTLEYLNDIKCVFALIIAMVFTVCHRAVQLCSGFMMPTGQRPLRLDDRDGHGQFMRFCRLVMCRDRT